MTCSVPVAMKMAAPLSATVKAKLLVRRDLPPIPHTMARGPDVDTTHSISEPWMLSPSPGPTVIVGVLVAGVLAALVLAKASTGNTATTNAGANFTAPDLLSVGPGRPGTSQTFTLPPLLPTAPGRPGLRSRDRKPDRLANGRTGVRQRARRATSPHLMST